MSRDKVRPVLVLTSIAYANSRVMFKSDLQVAKVKHTAARPWKRKKENQNNYNSAGTNGIFLLQSEKHNLEKFPFSTTSHYTTLRSSLSPPPLITQP
ncbi:hypothetical protein RRG08_011023 [Elysia crispata]|uniref:Uncharacterized protein n=1 Tax=Elysia crispata TaxID=231223 RepID=A0AAE0YD81_9GAST|nr:hypothetical protein RRG08_011023 [Elysia crispata]